jgi:hypothetical protein
MALPLALWTLGYFGRQYLFGCSVTCLQYIISSQDLES